jgi:N utilization substance protein B
MVRPALVKFAEDRLTKPDLVQWCLDLYDGIVTQKKVIDQKLAATAENWRLHRMLPADRNVLRIGAFELLFGGEPVPVVLNEAIELARRYGSVDSPGFINGVLDQVAKERATGKAG